MTGPSTPAAHTVTEEYGWSALMGWPAFWMKWATASFTSTPPQPRFSSMSNRAALLSEASDVAAITGGFPADVLL